jgi:hypothetical protein
MRSYSTRQVQANVKDILDTAEAGGEVYITRGGKRFQVVLVEGEAVEPPKSPEDVRHEEIVGLLQALVEQGRSRASAPQPLEAPRAPVVTVSVPEPEDLTEPQEPPAVPVVADEPGAPEEAEVVEEPLPVEAPPAAVPESVESESTPEEVEAVFPPGPGKVRKRPTSHGEEVRERDRTGVLRRDGRWELTVAAKEAPQHLVKKLIEEAPEEERDLLAAMDPEGAEVLELLRLRGAALRESC